MSESKAEDATEVAMEDTVEAQLVHAIRIIRSHFDRHGSDGDWSSPKFLTQFMGTQFEFPSIDEDIAGAIIASSSLRVVGATLTPKPKKVVTAAVLYNNAGKVLAIAKLLQPDCSFRFIDNIVARWLVAGIKEMGLAGDKEKKVKVAMFAAILDVVAPPDPLIPDANRLIYTLLEGAYSPEFLLEVAIQHFDGQIVKRIVRLRKLYRASPLASLPHVRQRLRDLANMLCDYKRKYPSASITE